MLYETCLIDPKRIRPLEDAKNEDGHISQNHEYSPGGEKGSSNDEDGEILKDKDDR